MILPEIGLDQLFSLFGMTLIFIGLTGGKRIIAWKIEVGPINKEWRAVAAGLGLLILFGVGCMMYLEMLNT